MTSVHPTLKALREESGFTMIIAIGVMFITGLLLVAAFTVANGDVHNSQRDVHAKQAYYEAIAGLQQYEYELQAEPNFWQTCNAVESKLSTEEKSGESAAELANKEKEHVKYVVTPLPANKQSACSSANPFTTMIESKGRYANTFRVRSTGYGPAESNKAPRVTRTVIGTFGVNGFLDYLWYTNFETEDPGLYAESNATLAKHCEGKHYPEWKPFYSCPSVEWNGDSIEGPFHTEDYAHITGNATFGRPNHEPVDPVQMKGTFPSSLTNCTQATFNTANGCPEESESLPLPAEDTSLKFYLEASGKYKGETWLQLEGTKMTVKKYNGATLETKTGVSMPANGLIYIETAEGSEGTCPPGVFNVEESDTSAEQTEAKYCGTVFVSGYYEKSLTIASQQDVIVNGNVYPKGTTLGSTPTSAYVLGLIANNYVRVYHPCASGKNTSPWSSPYVYAAILATKHSWIVDNTKCGSVQGELNIVGALAQNYRGVVYRSEGFSAHGYEKHYVYDERLATDEPPYFLAPLKAGWKITREISQKPG
jgi:Tfp pilus assembly protein PilX